MNSETNPRLMSHQQVLDYFNLSSRSAIYKWRQKRGFPHPVTLMPLRWERNAVVDWEQKQTENISSVHDS
ncbi:helix-turn-helix transcriptional regulator [Vibrio astriarenae]